MTTPDSNRRARSRGPGRYLAFPHMVLGTGIPGDNSLELPAASGHTRPGRAVWIVRNRRCSVAGLALAKLYLFAPQGALIDTLLAWLHTGFCRVNTLAAPSTAQNNRSHSRDLVGTT